MAFQKGQPRPEKAGRKKGTPNKRNTIFESLEQIHTEDGKPVDVLKLFFNDVMSLAPFQRAEYWAKIMEFIYPKQKNVEINSGEGGFKIVIEDYSKK